jgi:hypothetical protein
MRTDNRREAEEALNDMLIQSQNKNYFGVKAIVLALFHVADRVDALAKTRLKTDAS